MRRDEREGMTSTPGKKSNSVGGPPGRRGTSTGVGDGPVSGGPDVEMGMEAADRSDLGMEASEGAEEPTGDIGITNGRVFG